MSDDAPVPPPDDVPKEGGIPPTGEAAQPTPTAGQRDGGTAGTASSQTAGQRDGDIAGPPEDEPAGLREVEATAVTGGAAASPAPPMGPAAEPSSLPTPPLPAAEEESELVEALLTIWTEPRATIRRIVAVDAGFWVKRLAALVGLVFAVQIWDSFANARLPDSDAVVWAPSGSIILVVGLVLLPPLCIAGLYLTAWLTQITGAWLLDGRGDSRALRTAIAWSYIPLLSLLPATLLAPVLTQASSAGSLLASGVLGILGLLYFVAGIWSVVIQCQGVAEVQGYRSGWKGFLNLLLPGLLLVGVALVFGIVLGVAGALLGGSS